MLHVWVSLIAAVILALECLLAPSVSSRVGELRISAAIALEAVSSAFNISVRDVLCSMFFVISSIAVVSIVSTLHIIFSQNAVYHAAG